MGFGFSAQNNAGEIQIDQDYYNPHLFKEGSKTCTRGNTTGFNNVRITFAGRVDPPLVACSPGTGVVCHMGIAQINKTGGTLYDAVVLSHYQGLDTSYSVNYALYDAVGGIASNTNYGMQVFDGSGNVVFDSRRAYLKVTDIVDIPKPAIGTVVNSQHNHASTPNAYYVINSITGIVIVPSSGIGMVMGRGVRQVSNTQLEISHGPNGLASGVDVGVDTRVATKIMVCEKISI